MKYGFRLVYHKDIPESDMPAILDMLAGEKEHFCSDNSYKVGYTNSHSYYRRGIFGLSVTGMRESSSKPSYTFKRLVKNRRIFGVIPVEKLERVDGQPFERQCMCAEHRGGQRVKIKGGFVESDYVTYLEVGDIKG